MTKNTKVNSKRMIWHGAIFFGTIISIWSSAAFLSGLAQVNWQFSELLRHYLIGVGLMKEFQTLSDFYTHIKGIEYIIAVLFLGFFPLYYTYLNRTKGRLVVET
jgi:hypothetical protein